MFRLQKVCQDRKSATQLLYKLAVSKTIFTCSLLYLCYVRSRNDSLPVCSRSLQTPASSHTGRTLLSQLSSHPSEAAEPVSAVSPVVKGGSNRMRTRQYIKIRPLSLQPPRRLICGVDLWKFALWNVSAVAPCRAGTYTNLHKLLVNVLWYLQYNTLFSITLFCYHGKYSVRYFTRIFDISTHPVKRTEI